MRLPPPSQHCAARRSGGLPAGGIGGACGLGSPSRRQAKILVAGAGRDWPTAQEAVLKVHGAPGCQPQSSTPNSFCTAISPRSTRPFAPTSSRARARLQSGPQTRSAALVSSGARRPWCRPGIRSSTWFTLRLLMLSIAEARGIDSDPIHRDDERWARTGHLMTTTTTPARPTTVKAHGKGTEGLRPR